MVSLADLNKQASSLGFNMKKPNIFDKVKGYVSKYQGNTDNQINDYSRASIEERNRRPVKDENVPTAMEQSFDSSAEKTDPKMYYIIGGIILLLIVFRKKLGIKF